MTYEQLQITEPSVDDEPIGTYGTLWQEWMQNHHKKLVREMRRKGTFEAVARSVDDDAWRYRELLDRQYEEMHTRPLTFEEIVSWERTREYYTDSAVMRDNVLHPYTEP
jgi:hypothetical protein